jgi:hypothetical protein
VNCPERMNNPRTRDSGVVVLEDDAAFAASPDAAPQLPGNRCSMMNGVAKVVLSMIDIHSLPERVLSARVFTGVVRLLAKTSGGNAGICNGECEDG